MAKDRYGFGTSPDVGFAPTPDHTGQVNEDMQNMSRSILHAHNWIVDKFMPHVKENRDLVKTFVSGNISDKTAILREYANDTDDALWRSPAWQLIQSTSNN